MIGMCRGSRQSQITTNSYSQYDSEYVVYGEFNPIMVISRIIWRNSLVAVRRGGDVMAQGDDPEDSRIVSLRFSRLGVIPALDR